MDSCWSAARVAAVSAVSAVSIVSVSASAVGPRNGGDLLRKRGRRSKRKEGSGNWPNVDPSICKVRVRWVHLWMPGPVPEDRDGLGLEKARNRAGFIMAPLKKRG